MKPELKFDEAQIRATVEYAKAHGWISFPPPPPPLTPEQVAALDGRTARKHRKKPGPHPKIFRNYPKKPIDTLLTP